MVIFLGDRGFGFLCLAPSVATLRPTGTAAKQLEGSRFSDKDTDRSVAFRGREHCSDCTRGVASRTTRRGDAVADLEFTQGDGGAL